MNIAFLQSKHEMKLLLQIAIVLISIQVGAQSKGQLLFFPQLNNKPVEIGKTIFSSAVGDSVTIETLKFYVSNIQLMLDDQLAFTPEPAYLLVDLENPESLST